ncbi:hypothetical protein FA13DRAFT_1713218 [Coprinellus micaceus]|uniref:Uncharacterized protein n=1 Tax=Coprinellus micaceus TaxID=71717 RepID=A0A4Y7SXR6_COPMI|nr:hypothetical protein FA13DRAFT_1713218 [Coprinellus micaceus]
MIAITGVSLDGSGEGRQRTSTTPLREQEGKGGIATIAGVRRQEAEKNKQYLTARSAYFSHLRAFSFLDYSSQARRTTIRHSSERWDVGDDDALWMTRARAVWVEVRRLWRVAPGSDTPTRSGVKRPAQRARRETSRDGLRPARSPSVS